MTENTEEIRTFFSILKKAVICVWVQITPDSDGSNGLYTYMLTNTTKEEFVASIEQELGPIRVEYWKTVMDIYTEALSMIQTYDVISEAMNKIDNESTAT